MYGLNRQPKRSFFEIAEIVSPPRETKRRSTIEIAVDSGRKAASKGIIRRPTLAIAPDSPTKSKEPKRRTTFAFATDTPKKTAFKEPQRRTTLAFANESPKNIALKEPIRRPTIKIASDSDKQTAPKQLHPIFSFANESPKKSAPKEPFRRLTFSTVAKPANDTKVLKRRTIPAVAPVSPKTNASRMSGLSIAAESPTKSRKSSRQSNFAIAELETQSQATTFADGTRSTFDARPLFVPKPKSQKLSGRLSALFEIQARRSQASKKIKVDPKQVRFICGVNRFSDANYEYMVRVNGGSINLSELLVPVRLNVQIDVRSINSFKRPVIIGEAIYHVESQDSVFAMSARRDSS